MTPASLWRHKDVAINVTHALISFNARFTHIRFVTSFANFGFVMYRNQLDHVVLGCKSDVPCIVRTEALKGYSDTSPRLVHWLNLVAPSFSRCIPLCSIHSRIFIWNNREIVIVMQIFTSSFRRWKRSWQDLHDVKNEIMTFSKLWLSIRRVYCFAVCLKCINHSILNSLRPSGAYMRQ